ncbi:lactosylceramide 1,3-N-acetyl-beta-D-glucosaminyltransferase A-like [Sitophilus oryzae]|uniref:Hexosyltransferase n=1 Tax=Sitophilus oryzae TaxID=7048 RepID=A0A6J2Y039_SITOR|nr:lactosylceramide 1,3-N-acetyl-beta-D-glucosaminyltransferase A-like [Sitophilus oryzae]
MQTRHQLFLICITAQFFILLFIYKDNLVIRKTLVSTQEQLVLSEQDYSQLNNLTGFKFNILNNQTCSDKELLLLILVPSAPGNIGKRNVIRETWGSLKRDDVKVMFVLNDPGDESVQSKLLIENEEFEDIVQGSLMDTYRNLTYKTIMCLKYATYHCKNAKYVLKVDDDVFVNVPQMISFLENDLEPLHPENFLMCSVLSSSKVVRDRNDPYLGKYMATYEEFPDTYYPVYCAGWVALFSRDVVPKFYQIAQKVRYFYLEDVFTYGLVARRIPELKRVSIGSYVLDSGRISKLIDNSTLNYDFIIGWFSMAESKMRKLWDVVKKSPVKEHLKLNFEL